LVGLKRGYPGYGGAWWANQVGPEDPGFGAMGPGFENLKNGATGPGERHFIS